MSARMQWKNDPQRWGAVSQLLHWLIVVLIVVMAWLGLTMTDLPTSPYKIRVYSLHKSIGMTLLALVLLRLAWRAFAGRPDDLPGTPTWQHRLAGATHGLLYVLLLAVPISGWVMNSASGFPMPWFGLFNVPAITGRDRALHELSETWHEWLFWALVVIALVHAAAAVYHHLFQHDATLARMLPRGWLRAPAPDREPPHA